MCLYFFNFTWEVSIFENSMFDFIGNLHCLFNLLISTKHNVIGTADPCSTYVIFWSKTSLNESWFDILILNDLILGNLRCYPDIWICWVFVMLRLARLNICLLLNAWSNSSFIILRLSYVEWFFLGPFWYGLGSWFFQKTNKSIINYNFQNFAHGLFYSVIGI